MTRRRRLSHHIFKARLAAVLVVAVALGRVAALAGLALAAVMLPLRWLGGGGVAEAVPPPPTFSRYVTTVDTAVMNQMGCTRREMEGIVILSFGQPWIENGVYGVRLLDVDATYKNVLQVEAAVRAFIDGYMYCSTSGRMYVAAGVNNYGGATGDSVHGAYWALMVNRLNDYIVGRGWGARISADGAIDIEMPWNTAANTRAWVNGYDYTNSYRMYNFGSCDGCPSSTYPDWTPANGWSMDDIFYVSWAALPAYTIPQIYRNDGLQASQWQKVKLHGVLNPPYQALQFSGAASQRLACVEVGCNLSLDNTPEESWNQLLYLLNSDWRTQQGYLSWATEYSWSK